MNNLHQLDPPTADAYLVWVIPGEQPDYEAARPEPVVSKCRTCRGRGEAAKIGKPPASHRLLGHTTPCPNPDCVSGWVTNLGTIEWRCSNWEISVKTRDVGGTREHSELTALRTPCTESWTGIGHETCGLVLMIPIGADE